MSPPPSPPPAAAATTTTAPRLSPGYSRRLTVTATAGGNRVTEGRPEDIGGRGRPVEGERRRRRRRRAASKLLSCVCVSVLPPSTPSTTTKQLEDGDKKGVQPLPDPILPQSIVPPPYFSERYPHPPHPPPNIVVIRGGKISPGGCLGREKV